MAGKCFTLKVFPATVISLSTGSSLARLGDNVGQKGSPTVTSEADADGDSGTPAFPRGTEGIREDDGSIKFTLAQSPNAGLRVERDHFVEEGVILPQVVKFRGAEQGNVGFRFEFAKALHGGHAHDRITDPVGGAHQDAPLAATNDGRFLQRLHQSPSPRRRFEFQPADNRSECRGGRSSESGRRPFPWSRSPRRRVSSCG